MDGRTAPDAKPSEDISYYTASLRRYAIALTGNATDSEDLVQEALTKVLAHVRSGKEIRDLRAYLFSTLHNLWCGEISRKQKDGPMASETSGDDVGCAESQDLRVECRDLDAALRRLPESFRCVILLIGLEGYSYKAVSEMLGIPVGTVMSRLHRGREALREIMSERSFERVKRVK